MNEKQTRCKTGLSCHDDSPGSGHFPHSPGRGNVSHGTFYQCHLCGHAWPLVCLCVRPCHWHHPHDLYGDPAFSTHRSYIRSLFIRYALPNVPWQAGMGLCRGGHRHRHHRSHTLLSCHDLCLGKNRPYLVLLCAFLHCRHAHWRNHCISVFKASAESQTLIHVPGNSGFPDV